MFGVPCVNAQEKDVNPARYQNAQSLLQPWQKNCLNSLMNSMNSIVAHYKEVQDFEFHRKVPSIAFRPKRKDECNRTRPRLLRWKAGLIDQAQALIQDPN